MPIGTFNNRLEELRKMKPAPYDIVLPSLVIGGASPLEEVLYRLPFLVLFVERYRPASAHFLNQFRMCDFSESVNVSG